ncbi:MAG: DegT/DnrJ/EryC1/StrS family aminotransferase [Candidatus Acidiferrum sp.]
MRIPLAAPDIDESDIQAVTAVLRTSQLSLGPKLQEFERAMAQYIGTSHAVAVNSGTSALHLCLRGLEIGDGHEVIVPSFAFIAVANVARYVGAVPVFVDIDPLTRNLDPDRIKAAITDRTRAILVVHTFGCPANMAKILDIAMRHQLHVIEDACEAIGAEYCGRKVGSFGDAAVFGFYPNKQMTTGEGGCVVTDNPQFAAKIKSLRNQGRSDTDDWFQHSEIGYNCRVSEINCALGITQLNRLEEMLSIRESIAREYDKVLCDNSRLILPQLNLSQCKISWFVYVVQLEGRFTALQRDTLVKKMASRGIGCGRYFAPIHLQPAYRTEPHRCMDLSVTEFSAARMVALPFFNRITPQEISEVCHALQKEILAL